MRQVLALGEDSQSEVIAEAHQRRDGRRTSRELAQDRVVLVDEGLVVPGFGERRFEFRTGGHEGFGDEAPTELSESPSVVGTDHEGLGITHDEARSRKASRALSTK